LFPRHAAWGSKSDSKAPHIRESTTMRVRPAEAPHEWAGRRQMGVGRIRAHSARPELPKDQATRVVMGRLHVI
jgi:hypothetical protein